MAKETSNPLCANCHTPMINLALGKGVYYHWFCETCGLEHKQDKGDKA